MDIHLNSVRSTLLPSLLASLLPGLLAIFCLSPLAQAQDNEAFGQEELEAMVAELLPHAPEHPAYTYPIEITYHAESIVNAFAGCRVLESGELQATLDLYAGIVETAGYDRNLIRAIVAHELAHLVKGHALQQFDQKDFQHHLTRQQEREADALGAAILKEAGYEHEHMSDMLMMLDGVQSKSTLMWLSTVAGDHASPIARAAYLGYGSTDTYRAVALMETGLAFMQCRRFEEAIHFFDEALELQPLLFEARINGASAALQFYYEMLPKSVQQEWLRPDFGPHLTETILLGGRSVTITDDDRARYADVQDRLSKFPVGLYASMNFFLAGTAGVMHPDKDSPSIELGLMMLGLVTSLGGDLPDLDSGATNLRIANNEALGLQRQGKAKEAALKLIMAQSNCDQMITSAAENIGRLPFGDLNKEQMTLAANVLYTFLSSTPANAPSIAKVDASLEGMLKKLGASLNSPVKRPPVYLCAAVAIKFEAGEISLFKKLKQMDSVLGERTQQGAALAEFPDLQFLRWGLGDVLGLAEKGRLVMLTSYRAGSSIELRPADTSVRESYSIRVGMTKAELDELLATGGQDLSTVSEQYLMGRETLELWQYHAALNLAVLIKDGIVTGIKVTPVKV